MLGKLPSQSRRRQVFRFAKLSMSEELMSELGLDRRSGDELQEWLVDSGYGAQFDELLDGPFQPKPRLRRRTRFSDGSFPVFYSSLDAATGEAEIRYWFPRYGAKPQIPRTAYYQGFTCTFDGVEKDLRPKTQEWPDLVHDSDYKFCNQIGAEAKRSEIDGLVTWSVRHQGVNLPVFTRQAVSDARLESIVAMTYDPNTDEVYVQPVDE